MPLGPDAVMIRDEDALAGDDQTTKETTASGGRERPGCPGDDRGGTDLGKVVDVIIEAGRKPVVAGYEIEAPGRGHHRVLLPVVKPVAASGEMVLVPDATGEFTAGDLAGFLKHSAGCAPASNRRREDAAVQSGEGPQRRRPGHR